MKKTSVPNLIINALLLVEAVLIVFFLLRMITKPRDKEAGATVPDRELTIAEQEEEAPLPPVVGNSKPVDVEPVEGIRITAPANALDKDREFKITAVDEKTWDQTEKALAEVSGEQMLFCFDLDAGMEPDEHLPGEFTFSMDLEKMGIPPILYDKLTVWRLAGDQLYEYTSWVENGKMVFRSDQNSFMILAIPPGIALVKAFAVGLVGGLIYKYGAETWSKHKATGDVYKGFFTKNGDAMTYDLKDPYGDFTLYFRFKDTEYADRFETYQQSEEDFNRRSKDLVELAEREYNRQVEEKYNEERAEWTMWQKVMGSAEAKRKARAAIDKAAILAKLCEEDILLKRYAEGMQLPPSILDLCEMLKTANRFLTDNQCLRPQTCNLEVDLIQTGPSGVYNRTATKLPYLLINYSKMLTDGQYKRAGRGESMLLTITHELFHHRQKTHNWPAQMDFRSEETTAAYLENAAALYYIGTGEIVTNAASALATGKYEGGEGFDPAPRENYEYFGQRFGAAVSEANPAYTYADLMEYIQHQKKEKIAVKGGTFMDRYSYASSHKSNYMKWFEIKDEAEFTKYVQGFCEENIKKIYARQSLSDVPEDLKIQTFSVSRANPVVKAATVKGELIMRGFDIKGEEVKDGRFHAFLVPGKACTEEEITFYSSADLFATDRKKGNRYFDADAFIHGGAYFKPNSSVLPFTVVALYAPDKPEIKKVKKDYVRFVLPKADKALVKNGYITGALVTFRNAEGQEKYIRAGIEKLGKDVKWSIPGVGLGGFSLRVKWICENKDGSVYESPASKPSGQGSVPEEKEPVTASANVEKEKDVPAKEDKKPVEQRDSEENLTLVEEIKDVPWEKVAFSVHFLSAVQDHQQVTRYQCGNLGSIVWNAGGDYAEDDRPGIVDEFSFGRAREGYVLICTARHVTSPGEFFRDASHNTINGEYQLSFTLVLDEDLTPISGSYQGSTHENKKLDGWYATGYLDNGMPKLNKRSSEAKYEANLTYSGAFSVSGIDAGGNCGINQKKSQMQGHWAEAEKIGEGMVAVEYTMPESEQPYISLILAPKR